MTTTAKKIAVFGSSKPMPQSHAYRQAYELGRAIALAGYQLVNGGYGGTMAASAKGAKDHGGYTIGVTCHAFGRSEPNPWLEQEIQTKSLNERLQTLIDLAQAYIVLPGSTGTLLELAMSWELINKHFIPQRPIICVSDYFKPIVDTIVGTGEVKGNTVCFVPTVSLAIKTLTVQLP